MHTDTSLAQAARRFAAAAAALSDASCPTQARPQHEDATQAPPSGPLAELLALLGEQAEWRAYVDGTRNLGHQASTVLLLRRLIELTSFTGRVVVVYADPDPARFGSSAEKLALMFAGLEPRGIDKEVASHASCREIRFLPLTRAAELRESIAFGFSGGADDMQFNGAAVLNVRFFMRLQPYLWDDPPSAAQDPYYECSRIEQPDGRHLYPVQAWPELRTLAVHPPQSVRDTADPSYWRWFARQQTFDPGLASRMRNALAVLAAHRDGRCLLWPVYGLQHFKQEAAAIMLSCTLAALALASARRCTIALCSFSPDDRPDWTGPVQTIAAQTTSAQPGDAQPWSEWLRSNAPGVALHLHRSRGADGRGHNLQAPFDEMATPGQRPVAVHVFAIGPVAMDAFHQFVLNADLPCVIEGQTTANLLTVLGRPFLQVLRDEHVIKSGYPTAGPPPSADTAQRLAALGAELRTADPRELAAGGAGARACTATLRQIRRLLDDVLDEGSEIRRYFAAVGQDCARPSRDKLMVMLLALREVMLAAND